jgi:hypothetical protein
MNIENTSLVIKGYVHIVLTDAQGNIKQEEEGDNLITTVGNDT